MPAVSKRLGHANPAITARIYAHALSQDELDAADLWEKVQGKIDARRNAKIS